MVLHPGDKLWLSPTTYLCNNSKYTNKNSGSESTTKKTQKWIKIEEKKKNKNKMGENDRKKEEKKC
jgi:hypothetical protein